MKRSELLRHLKKHGAVILREGSRHSIYQKGPLKTEVPRHNGIGSKNLQGLEHTICEGAMRYRAVIKKTGDWWIGWLIDLPGVNAQERTRERLLESLQIGAKEMLASEVPFEASAEMTTIDVPDPAWA